MYICFINYVNVNEMMFYELYILLYCMLNIKGFRFCIGYSICNLKKELIIIYIIQQLLITADIKVRYIKYPKRNATMAYLEL